MHKNPETLTTLFSSGTKLLLPSWLLGLRHEERETQFLICWLFHQTQQTRGASRRSTGLASPKSESQLTAFSKITKIPSPSFPGMTSFVHQVHFLSGVFIMTFVIVTSSAHERGHLHSMCPPARGLSRIVLSLTKPNDKIYPTKNDYI